MKIIFNNPIQLYQVSRGVDHRGLKFLESLISKYGDDRFIIPNSFLDDDKTIFDDGRKAHEWVIHFKNELLTTVQFDDKITSRTILETLLRMIGHRACMIDRASDSLFTSFNPLLYSVRSLDVSVSNRVVTVDNITIDNPVIHIPKGMKPDEYFFLNHQDDPEPINTQIIQAGYTI
ncbi:hypothetical protein CKO50_20335 [Pseudoalteromonas sp. HM-SA03]|uniref:hypothetical protein n=1 Tax=Pseudoalteromonas sp. HM-SA03 TaxID=2029678 RepID=UPI000BAE4096|nr:hypothetical protein [Pseudoalteromonas sp. HM-SA03]PAX99562.1 hypothetical protein CKO50_20335 [Pseudoalteromonas sp. HM-SA03]